MSYSATLTIAGNVYNYPAGPTYPGVSVEFLTDDVIVHNGLCAPPTGVTPTHLVQHTCQLFKDGTAITPVVQVPFLEWNSEYGFDLNPDPTPAFTPAQLIAKRLALPIGPIATGKAPAFTKRTYTGPGSLAGVTAYMGQTGERDDIGLFYENSAEYFFNNNPANLLAFARGLRPFDVFVRDESTGKPIDKIKYPKASTYPGSQGQPGPGQPGYIAPSPAPPNPVPTNWASWDWGHVPEAAYLAFCLTGKLRYLRILQYYANESTLWSIFKPFAVPFAPTTPIGQTRGVAWCPRNVLFARRATELAEELGLNISEYGLMPSSYFKQQCDLNLRLFREFYMADPAIQVHRFWPLSAYPSPWQQDYLGIVLGMWAYMYPGEIDDLYLWDLGNLMPRVDGKSGFPPCINSTYRLNCGPNFPANAAPNPFTCKPSDFDPDWGATYARLKAGTNYAVGEVHLTAADFALADADQYNKDQWTAPDLFYHFHVHARLAIALFLDTQGTLAGKVSAAWPELKQSYGHIHQMALNWMAKDPANVFPAKVSFLPANGEIIMPTSISISLGQKVHLDVAFTGPKPPQPPTYTQTDGTIGSLTSPDMSGVLFTSQKVGSTTVTAATTGVSGPISADCVVTVTNPLPTAISLTPGTVS